MIIEAIRMHVDAHNGIVPNSLSDLRPVPALPNSVNSRTFVYQVELQEADTLITITAEAPPTAGYLEQIRIRFEK